MKTITLQEICKVKKIAPKIARSRLRRALVKEPKLQPATPTRWVWPINRKALVMKYISD